MNETYLQSYYFFRKLFVFSQHPVIFLIRYAGLKNEILRAKQLQFNSTDLHYSLKLSL